MVCLWPTLRSACAGTSRSALSSSSSAPGPALLEAEGEGDGFAMASDSGLVGRQPSRTILGGHSTMRGSKAQGRVSRTASESTHARMQACGTMHNMHDGGGKSELARANESARTSEGRIGKELAS